MLFLSYASPDRSRVEPFFEALEQFGFDPWMDCRKLRAGQNWDFEIQRALDQAKIVLVFLSHNSVDRRGYVQREIRTALRKLEEKLIDDVYLIPITLDEVERPRELKSIQFVDASKPDCLEDIRFSVSEQLKLLGESEKRETEIEGVKYRKRSYSDSYDGIPGFEVSADYVGFSSSEYPNLENATDRICGEISRSVMAARSCVTEPDSSHYNIGQARWSRTNTLDWVLSEVVTSGRVLSVVYSVHSYFAGAAHPVSGYRTFNFFLSPLIEIDGFESLVEDKSCLNFLQSSARAQIKDTLTAVSESDPPLDWIARGTEDWECFRNFSIRDGKFVFFFGSYQVAAYVYGHQTVEIPIKDFARFLTPFAANSLDLGWERQNLLQQI